MAAFVAVVAAAAVLPIVTGPVAVGVTTSTWNWQLAPGVKLTRIRYSTPREVRVLTVTPSAGPRVDVMTAGSIIGQTKRTSGQGTGVAGNSVAGVNGDFVAGPGFPAHALMVDGEMWSSGGGGRGTVLAVNANGSRAWVGTPTPEMSLAYAGGSRALVVNGWNAPRTQGAEAIGYTRRGGYIAQPDGVSAPTASDPQFCAARLVPTTGLGWSGEMKHAIVRTFKVQTQPEPCKKSPLSFGTNPEAVVVAARSGTVPGNKIKSLAAGNVVKMSWGFAGWPGVVDVIGGNPQVVDDGVNVAPAYDSADYLTGTHPRTAVAVTKGCPDDKAATECRILVVTVDGRQSADGWATGMRLTQLAAELLKLQAWDAVNLDGGGSTTMWARRQRSGYCQSYPSTGGCLVNRPPGPERSVITGLAVLSGVDEATPAGLR